MKHAKFSPSSAHRWLACPGAIKMCEGVPKKNSLYALEGSAAHKLAELCLTKQMDLNDSLNEVISLENGAYRVTQNMIDAVEVYIDYVNSLKGQKAYEQEVGCSWISKELFGTVDCIVYNKEDKILYVIDYKHGQGEAVEPESNPQLMTYALGAIEKIWRDLNCPKVETIVEEIRLTIIQPRAIYSEESIKIWSLTFEQLMNWVHGVLKLGIEKIENGDTTLNAGNHCKFCDAKAVCSAQAAKVKDVTKIEVIERKKAEFIEPVKLTPVQIANVLLYSNMIKSWLKAVEDHAKALAEAGTKFDSFKLVKAKTNRKWIDEDDAANTLFEILGDDTYKQSLISIADAEKKLKKLGKSSDIILEGLFEKPQGALTLVPITDKRQEVIPEIAQDVDLNEFFS